VLLAPVSGIAPTMISRAGALDQGNIAANLHDTARRGITDQVLFLAGSAFNSIKNEAGEADAALAVAAMQQAIEIHRAGHLDGVHYDEHLGRLVTIARRDGLEELGVALRQRYGVG
jgi:ribulose-bisphosphate carboxylase large chain